MIMLSNQARMKRLESILKEMQSARRPVTNGGNGRQTEGSVSSAPQAIDAAWLELDEEGNRHGPPDDATAATKAVYQALIRMDEATCKTNQEEV